MRKSAQKILDQALKLPEAERLSIADALLGTVLPDTEASIEAEWLREAERRSRELEAAPTTAIPYATAVRHVEARLRRKS